MSRKEFIKGVLKENGFEGEGLEKEVKEVEEIVKEVEGGRKSKSKGILELGDKNLFVGSIGKILGIRYNFCYNILSEKGGNIRRVSEERGNKGNSKSDLIRYMYYSEGIEKVGEICKRLVEKYGVYVNYNMCYSVIKKEKKRREKLGMEKGEEDK